MEFAALVLAGGFIGLAGFSWFKLNAARGLMVSIVIGAAAGVFGGAVLAPMLGATMLNPGDFNPLVMFMAVVSAVACLTIGNMIHNRFGV